VAVDLRALAVIDKDSGRPSIVGGGSIYPFCHNILLAARARGLGGVLTTLITRVEAEARPLLGLEETHALAGMVFLGHPVHQPTRLRRKAVEEFTTVDRLDGPPF
ncbi:MAG TPA: nitroreductase family protein, partial [Acidimicrobiales bacterium]